MSATGDNATSERAEAGTVSLEAPEYLPISFLNALVYCPRRFYYEYAWGEMLVNEHVLQGRVQHAVADAGGAQTADGAFKLRRVYVYSDRLQISGLIDVVEAPLLPLTPQPLSDNSVLGDALDDPLAAGASGVAVSMPVNTASFYPVEYKKGSARGGRANDHVQLCAQGLCLEERAGQTLAGGYVFSFGTMHRTWIPFSTELRALTEVTIARAFALLRAGHLPAPLPAEQDRKCRACSLEPLCLPREVRTLSGGALPYASQSSRL